MRVRLDWEKMQLLVFFSTLTLVCAGVTKTGLSDFWTDDYKVFEQVYGKTSDKDLFSETLPISHSNFDKFPRTEATEKKERFVDNQALSDFDSYGFSEKYAKLFAKQILEQDKITKPPKTFNFVSFSDTKPISKYTDPETYSYLKHLEQYTIDENGKFTKGIGYFKPYFEDSGKNQVYKSIQDILDAHEANKSGEEGNDDVEEDERDEQIKHLTLGNGNGRLKSNRKKPGGETAINRCRSGRCRKRATSNLRVWNRPYVRKITQNRWIAG